MHDPEEHRWRARPLMGAALRTAVFLVPLGLAILAAGVTVKLLPQPDTRMALIAWWVLVIGSTIAALYVFDRLARKLLPLAALMKMTMVFPDHAPSRMDLAKRAGRTRDLRMQLAESRILGQQGDAQVAAEQVLTLLSALTEHDRGTRGHSERVRVLVDMISEELKLTRPDRDRLRWAALLHDIGKLAVPQELLNKKGDPDEAEWELIRTHPGEGRRLVAPLSSFLGEWVGAIEHHHEKWDGTGYSLGLAGEEISLGGRIVAVADSYEVITGSRPYKKPLGVKAAREELAHQAGTHFDPHVVRALFNISLGRLWRAIGFSSWLATLPFLPPWLMPRLSDAIRNLGGAAAAAATAIALGGGLIAQQTLVTAPRPQRPSPVLAQAPAESTQPTEVLGVKLERPEVPAGTTATTARTSPPTAVAPLSPAPPAPPTPAPAPPPPPPPVEGAIRASHGKCVSGAARDMEGPKGPQVREMATSDKCR
ncbi:MAG TPA: HD-GYP domain-containing protein [Actinomycetota bacterium]|nr:HD-GYP domain-containing protein [Actinomycetota bacterium]